MLKFKNTLNSLALSIILAVIIGSPFVLIAIKERDVTLEKVQIIDFKILSAALNEKIQKDKDSKSIIKKALNFKNACIIEVFIHPNQKINPKLAFGCPIEDLEPRLARSEFLKQMFIKPVTSDNKVIEAN